MQASTSPIYWGQHSKAVVILFWKRHKELLLLKGRLIPEVYLVLGGAQGAFLSCVGHWKAWEKMAPDEQDYAK